MDVSEMLESVKSALTAAWKRFTFFARTYRGVTASVILLLGVGLIFWAGTGFSLEFSRFFAAAPGPEIVINSALPVTHGTKLSVSWSANTATSCTSSGWINTEGKNEGTAESDAVNACGGSSGTFEIKCCYSDGACGVTRRTFAINTATCPTSPAPTSGGGPSPTSGGPGTPVDPSGACVFRTDAFNDPDGSAGPNGAWFCQSLKCALAGNPPFEPISSRKSPEGPATRLAVNVMGQGSEPVDPSLGPIHIRTKLDSTPKCGNGKECYPPRDPLWSCTQENGKEVDLGRNGHDYYDCYNPIIHRRDYGKITCCANTGLSGDCFTWNVSSTDPIPPSAGPDSSTSPGPSTPRPIPSIPYITPSDPPPPVAIVSSGPTNNVRCGPIQQTVETNQIARLQASGGTNYTWNVGGGTIVEDTGSAISVRFSISGTKTIRVASGGQTATCTITVEIPEATTTPPRASGTPVPTGGYVTPLVSNGVTVTPEPGSRDTDGDGMIDTVECPNASRCPDSDGDGVADWQDSDIRNRTGRVLSASEVATGPGEATVLALIISALVSLLYVTYTHSPLALKREVEDISKERDPLDFRS